VGITLALLSAVLLGSADFVGGLAARRASAIVVVTWSNALGLLTALVVLLVLPARLSLIDFGWALLAGTCGSIGAALLYRALAVGMMSLVAPATATAAALIPVAAGALMGERLTASALAGMTCALLATVLLSGGRSERQARSADASRALVLAVLAGASFGAFLVLLSQASADAGLWPVAIARAAALAVLLSLAWTRREGLQLSPPSRRLALGAGLLDIAANAAFLIAVRHGPLAVTGLLASLSPLGTILLARILLDEKLRGTQRLGTAMAMGSVVLLTLR
jgi:drug/metabolite transporter (DMT)-like permease